MKARTFAVLVAGVALALLAGGCATAFKASTVDGAVKASNAFGFDFYRQAKEGKDNFVCSPAGAAIALTMTAAGARGETQSEMLHTLHIDPTNLDATYASFAAILTALNARNGTDGPRVRHTWPSGTWNLGPGTEKGTAQVRRQLGVCIDRGRGFPGVNDFIQ
jgi:hypothetical protein